MFLFFSLYVFYPSFNLYLAFFDSLILSHSHSLCFLPLPPLFFHPFALPWIFSKTPEFISRVPSVPPVKPKKNSSPGQQKEKKNSNSILSPFSFFPFIKRILVANNMKLLIKKTRAKHGPNLIRTPFTAVRTLVFTIWAVLDLGAATNLETQFWGCVSQQVCSHTHLHTCFRA